MIITCDQCNTKFNLDESLLTADGSKVRCSLCKTVFTAYPLSVSEVPEATGSDVEPEQALFDQDQDLSEDSRESEEDLSQEMAAAFDDLEETSLEDTGGGETTDLEIDELEDVAKMFEMDEASEAPESEDAEAGEELDLDLDFEAEEPTVSGPVAEEELDLSELDDDLDFEEESETDEDEEDVESLDIESEFDEIPVLESEADEALDLSELEDDPEFSALPEEADDEEAEADEDEEFDLDLDFESEDAPVSEEETEEELDLADFDDDLELEMESEEAESEEADADEELDLDLDIDLDIDAVPVSEDDAEEELDLSDIEDSLELDEASEEPDEEDDLETLDLDLEEPADDQEEAAFEEETLDLSDIEKMIEDEETPEASADETPAQEEPEQDAAEAEMDDQVDDILISADEPDDGGKVVAAPAFGVSDMDDQEEFDTLDDLEGPEPAVGKKKKDGKKKRIGAPVLVLLLLLLIGGGGYGAFVGLTAMGIQIPYMDTIKNIGSQIPFLGDFLKPAVQDAGNLKISTIDIAGKFVNNTGAGKLFVITGNAKNGYPESRALIKIDGKLYSKGKSLVKTEKVYCGNNLTDKQLSEMDLETIRKQLKNRAGAKKSNLNVAPGRVIPFMVVFSDLPENLEEYTIEVEGSFPVAKK